MNPRTRILAVLAAAVVLTGAGVAVASAAESPPSTADLLRDCNVHTDFCGFTVTESKDVLGPQRQVSDAAFNCSPDDQTYEKDWAATTTNSVNVSVEMSIEAGFATVFKASFKVSTGYEWSTSKTVTDRAPIKVRSGWVGWIERADSLTEVTGNYELRHGSRKAGHYYWYVNGVRFTGPTQDAKGNLIAQTRPMTDTEKTSYCANPPSASTKSGSVKMKSSSAVESTPLD
jgi:hypothetical protein